MKKQFNIVYLPLTLLLFLPLAATNSYAEGETTRVSIDSEGVEGNFASLLNPSISADGRYVAFSSIADNLVLLDTNSSSDIFVHDRLTGNTRRASVNSTGVEGNGSSSNPSISDDGRYVAFGSSADNLVPEDTNGVFDIFVHDLTTGATSIVNISSAGVQAKDYSDFPAISADGRYVAFHSIASNLVREDTNGFYDVFVHDRLTGKTTRVSVDSEGLEGNSGSIDASISPNGRYVAFMSAASNLVSGDANDVIDIFVHDRTTDQTTRVSVDSDGEEGNSSSVGSSISADGRYVAFESLADNLVPEDTNEAFDVFVHDLSTDATTRVSVQSGGGQATQSSGSGGTAISADGRFVAFSSSSPDLVPGDTNNKRDAFVHDLLNRQTTRVSLDSAGLEIGLGVFDDGDDFSDVHLSADGRHVVFESNDSNIVPEDTNATTDIFVRDRLLDTSQNVDLQVAVTSQPDSVQNGEIGRYFFTISNNGPDSADSVNLLDVVSEGKVWSLTPSQGDCSIAAVSVCRLGSLAPGESATVRTVFKAKGDPLTQQISVSASQKESDPATNSLTVATPVTPEPPVTP
ncbi:MAG: hypothetical protein ACXWT4_13380 [Methylobacter sp.]